MTRTELIDRAVREATQTPPDEDQTYWCLDIEDCGACQREIHRRVKSNWHRHVDEEMEMV